MERLLTRGGPRAAASLAKARPLVAMLVCALASFALAFALAPASAYADVPAQSAVRVVSVEPQDASNTNVLVRYECDFPNDVYMSIIQFDIDHGEGSYDVRDYDLSAFDNADVAIIWEYSKGVGLMGLQAGTYEFSVTFWRSNINTEPFFGFKSEWTVSIFRTHKLEKSGCLNHLSAIA